MNDKAAIELARVLEAMAQRLVSMDAKLTRLTDAMEQQEKDKDAAALEAVTANHGQAVARSLQHNRRALRELAAAPVDEFAGYMPGAEHLPD